MNTESIEADDFSIQESDDHIHIGPSGIKLLYAIAGIAFVSCSLAVLSNLIANQNIGNGGGVAGIAISILVGVLLYLKYFRFALISILWGFAFIPVLYGMRTFGFDAPGLVFVPVAVMATSWALSLRHAVGLALTLSIVCILGYILISRGIIVPISPRNEVKLIIFIAVILVGLMLGLVGVNALRNEFSRVKELAHSLELKAIELRRSEASFSAFFKSNPLPSLSSGADGTMLDVNDAFVTGFGYDKKALIGKTVVELALFSDEMERRSVARDTLKAGVVGRSVSMRLANGEPRNFLISTSAFQLSGGLQFIAVLLDQTDRIAAERAQHFLNVELEHRVEERTQELSEALERLTQTQSELVQSEKLAALGSLVAGIAHELNTPVGNALMVTSTLAHHHRIFEESLEHGLSRSNLSNFSNSVAEVADILDRNLRRTADLINSFKQVAVDQTSEQRRRFNLHDAAHEIEITLSPSLRKTRHKLTLEIPEGIQLDSYPGPLEHVFMNLVNNSLRHAFDYLPEGEMRLVAEQIEENWVRIRFADNGSGIPEQNLQKVFDPFFTTKLGQGGSGLGLSIVYNIVTAMLGGRIELICGAGKGAEFIIDLPLVAPQKQAV